MATVRKAVAEDVPNIVSLYEQLALGGGGGEKTAEDAPTRYAEAFEEITALPGCEVIVAEDNGRIVGTTMLTIVPNLSHGGFPWTIVENVVVDSTCRGTGVGKLLMEYVKEKAAEAGCYKIQLMSDKRRDQAHAFYRAIGYNATAEGFRFYL